jgi:hypothetical protein
MSATDKNLEPPARLQFLTGWQTVKHGSIRPGGQLIIDYDICRLSNLRTRFRDIIFWKIEAFVRFHPSGQLDTSSVIGGNFDDRGRRPFRGIALNLLGSWCREMLLGSRFGFASAVKLRVDPTTYHGTVDWARITGLMLSKHKQTSVRTGKTEGFPDPSKRELLS